MKPDLKRDENAAVPPWILGIALLVVGVIAIIILVVVGLCVASAFLPVIIVLVGLVMVWKGTKGVPFLILVGFVVLAIGVVMWLWS